MKDLHVTIMLPSQQQHWKSWHGDHGDEDLSRPAKVADNKTRSRQHLAGAKQPRRVSRSGAEISDTAASLEGEATLRLLADPNLYAEFNARVKKHRPATNVATHELLRQFLAEKKYCDQKKLDPTKNETPNNDTTEETQLPPRTAPGRLGNFLSRNQERQKLQRAQAANTGNGSLPSLEEISEKHRMQRRNSIEVVSMASSSSVSTQTTSASTHASTCVATDNSSFEVSLSGWIHPTNWFPGLK